MPKERKTELIPIGEDITLINDNGDSTCYLVRGPERALLIDTANGPLDLKSLCATLTDKPVTVVNTHGHCDHVFGNLWFDEAWLAPEDWPIHDQHFSFPEIKALEKENGHKPAKLLPLKAGQTFDLGGGRVLECVPVPGHTPGSMCLLDRKHRILFAGDAANGHIWMQLGESLPIATLRESLLTLRREHGADFDHLLCGHARGLEPAAERIEGLVRGCDELLAGKRGDDRRYEGWTYCECYAHQYDDDPGHCIVYSEAQL